MSAGAGSDAHRQEDASHGSRTMRGIVGLLLTAMLALGVVRLGVYLAHFWQHSLQTDFCVYYSAGQSLNHGLSPYRNNVAVDPALWDGKSKYQTSRFLYPPLAATLFQPLAALPYPVAKLLWSLFILGCFVASLWLTMRLVGPADLNLRLLCWCAAVWSYPLLANLERGQIDLVTLLLIVLAMGAAVRATRGAELGGGVFLAVATLLKLHVVLIIPFLLLRRKYWMAGGYAAGAIVLAALSLVANGPQGVRDYAFNHFQRISRYGEYGPKETLLPRESLPPRPSLFGQTRGRTTKAGHPYLASGLPLDLVSNASVVRPLAEAMRRAGWNVSNGTVSLLTFGAAFAVLWLLLGHHGLALQRPDDAATEVLLWYVPITLTLLCGPFTWVMNVVWLLPLLFVIAAVYERCARHLSRGSAAALGGVALGLIIAMLPDPVVFPSLPSYESLGDVLLRKKYLLAELLVLGGVTAFIRFASVTEAAGADSAPQPQRTRPFDNAGFDDAEEAVAV